MYGSDRIIIIVGIVVTIIAFASAFVFAGTAVEGPYIPHSDPAPFVASEERAGSGQASEQSETVVTENIINPISINLTLAWMDEGDATNRHTNAPDQFGLALEGPGGLGDEISYVSNTHGQQGEVTMNFRVPREAEDWTAGTGDWNITVRCGDCGDHTPLISIIGFRNRADNGNNWELKIEIQYYEFEDQTGGEQ